VDFFLSYSPADEAWAVWIAWELEWVGYRVVLQAWDFVPGTNFLDFMDRGVSQARAVVALLSSAYLTSRYGRLEWLAAFRAHPEDPEAGLITVRIEDCAIDGLLAMITFVDLVGVTDPHTARTRLLDRIRHAVDGRAKPTGRPAFPNRPTTPSRPPAPLRAQRPHNVFTAPPAFPVGPADGGRPRAAVSVVHLSRPGVADLRADEVERQVARLCEAGAGPPDLVVVTGGITRHGAIREFDLAADLLTTLRDRLGLPAPRLVVVPGPADVSAAACHSHHVARAAEDEPARWPYWPKWRHVARLFADLYPGHRELAFTEDRPWTLSSVPELRTVVCGVNSTMDVCHLGPGRPGHVGAEQSSWFTAALHPYADAGWLRVAVVHDAQSAATGWSGELSASLNLVVGGSAFRVAGPVTAGPPAHGDVQVLTLAPEGLTEWSLAADDRPVRSDTAVAWDRVPGTFSRSDAM
ncbi:MAG: TIR domain-containing protein, partial [Saccharothrix sp.]|nr:TIR domain-containing protein [Saccharothrix sp.]